MPRPHVADDFAAIRARMEELRRVTEPPREDAMELARRAYRQAIREAVLRQSTEGAERFWRPRREWPEDCEQAIWNLPT